MSDEPALLATIAAQPGDATARLVYADWLDEHARPLDAALQRVLGEPAEDRHRLDYAAACERQAERLSKGRGRVWANRYDTAKCLREYAEFIRVQVELSQIGDDPVCQATEAGFSQCFDPNCPIVRRSDLNARAKGLLDKDHTNVNGELPNYVAWFGPAPSYSWHGKFRPEYARGFAGSLTCIAADWLEHADTLLACHPVTAVTLTRWPTIASVNEWERQKYGHARQFGYYESARAMLQARSVGVALEFPSEEG